MTRNLLLLTLCLSFFQIGNAQQVISSTFLQSYDLDYFKEELEIIFSNNGVDLYRVNYTTTNAEGALDTASGLVCVPDFTGFNFPLVSYAHGTVASRFDVPSYLSLEHNLPAIYASVGTVCVAPDYLGLGDSDGVHPYVHAATEASASFDLIIAVEEFLDTELGISLNDQLFVTGYSQGGHAAMALHRYIETETDIEVTAAFPMSGPYSISTGMKDLLVSEEEYQYVAYLAATAISYQFVYGTIYPNGEITEFFKQPYANIIQKYINEESDLLEINAELIDSLIAIEGGSFPKKMIQEAMLDSILTNDNHPVNIALRDNDVYDWAPEADTRLLYCQADDQVAFENSIIARDKMIENGANQVIAIDLNSDFNHTECVTPAATSFVLYLLITANPTSTITLSDLAFKTFPNPTTHGFTIEYNDEATQISADLFDMAGNRKMKMNNLVSGTYIDVNLTSGMYVLIVKDQKGQTIGIEKIIIN